MNLNGINTFGTMCWYDKSRYHREDGPAKEFVDGATEWYLYGKVHREDGPACEYIDGSKRWFLHDTELSEEFFNRVTKGPVKELPLYLGLGFDDYIAKRLKS